MTRRTVVLSVIAILLVPTSILADESALGKSKNEWIKILKEDESARKREAAVIVLSTMTPRDGAILDSIADAMVGDKAERVRLKALDGVAAILTTGTEREKPARLVAAFGKSLSSDPEESVRLKATGIAKDLKPNELKQLVPVLSDVLRTDKSSAIRAAAAAALGRAGEHAKTVVNIIV